MSSLSGGNVAQGLIVDANTLLGQQMDKPTQQAGVSESSQQPSDAQQKLQTFWLKQTEEIQNLTSNDFKTQELPLARIKKIMKMDEDVKMIAAEAPLLFSKAAQIFITELSLRAWIHTEDSKRRTLQRNDIATAITKFDQFDFLIDIVPREELKPPKRPFGASTAGDPVPFFYTLPQQTASTNTVNTSVASLHQGTAPVSTLQSGQILVAQPSQPGQPLSLTPVNLENVQQQQTTQQQNQPAVVLNTQQPDNTQLQKQDDGTANQSKEQKQQNAQAILQQLMSNLPAVGPGEVHTIQINSQGQLQLVKTQTNQAQTGTSQEGQSGRRLIAGNNGQMFELTGVEEPARHSDADGSNQGTIYVQQEN